MATVLTIPSHCEKCGRKIKHNQIAILSEEPLENGTLYKICCQYCYDELDIFWICHDRTEEE